MILEVAILDVKTGQQALFENDFILASKYIASANGYLRHSLKKCIEKDNRYILLVEWQGLEDHTIGFRQSTAYEAWKKILHHYYDPFPTVEHFETVIDYKH